MTGRAWCVVVAVGVAGCRVTPSAATQPVAGSLAAELAVGRLGTIDRAIWELSVADHAQAERIRAQLRGALVRSEISPRAGVLAEWWQTHRASVGRSSMSFQGLRAHDHLVRVCGFGPRPSGSEGLRRMQAFLEQWFTARGVPVRRQAFAYHDPESGQTVPMVNLIASLNPSAGRRVLVGTHVDTRRWADEEPDPARRAGAVIGANDGGSGAAVMLELAEIVVGYPPHVGVDLVFFDGEEYAPKGSRDYFLGSKHFAARCRRADGSRIYAAAVIVDMIGGKHLRVPREARSLRCAGPLVDEIWVCARSLGHGAFVDERGPAIEDDHVALCEAGIPSVLLIDFSYPHRHRHTDVPARCDLESLRAVGQVLTCWIYRQPRPI